MPEYIQIEKIWHIPVGNDATLCGIHIKWFDHSRVESVCHAEQVPDIACVDCAMLEEILTRVNYPER